MVSSCARAGPREQQGESLGGEGISGIWRLAGWSGARGVVVSDVGFVVQPKAVIND